MSDDHDRQQPLPRQHRILDGPVDGTVPGAGRCLRHRADELGGTAPAAPVYLYSGVNDEIVPIATVDRLAETYCAGGTPLTYPATTSVCTRH
ncbi:hypothetical protein GS436_16360 [Rhodococcus hoagii]|nr:hypothetical protein [Prescottella equi]